MSITNGALPSPRGRGGVGVDGVMGESWMRRRPSERSSLNTAAAAAAAAASSDGAISTPTSSVPADTPLEPHPEYADEPEAQSDGPIMDGDLAIPQSVYERPADATIPDPLETARPSSTNRMADSPHSFSSQQFSNDAGVEGRDDTLGVSGSASLQPVSNVAPFGTMAGPPPGLIPNESVQWSYKDHDGNIQGPYAAPQMHQWAGAGYFPDNILIQRIPPYDPLEPHAFLSVGFYKEKLPPHLADNLFMRGMELAPPRPPQQFIDEHRDRSLLPPSRTGSVGAPPPPYQSHIAPGGGSGYSSPFAASAVAIGNNGIGAADVSSHIAPRHQGTGFDSFSTMAPAQNQQLQASPLGGSPALSSGLAQSFGSGSGSAFPAHFGTNVGASGGRDTPLSAVERDRQERDDYFKSLREQELANRANMAPGPIRTNSLNNGMSGPGVGMSPIGYGSPSPFGGQQPVMNRSPLYANASSVGSLGGYQQSQPSQGLNAYQSAFPRPGAVNYPQTQQNIPTPSINTPGSAWNQAPAGYLSRQMAPPSVASQSQAQGWNDPFARPQQDDGWGIHRQQIASAMQPQAPPSQQFFAERPPPPTGYMSLGARFSTAMVQSQVETNLVVPKVYSDPTPVPMPMPTQSASVDNADISNSSAPATNLNLGADLAVPSIPEEPSSAGLTPSFEREVDQLTDQLDSTQVVEEAQPIAEVADVVPEEVAPSEPTPIVEEPPVPAPTTTSKSRRKANDATAAAPISVKTDVAASAPSPSPTPVSPPKSSSKAAKDAPAVSETTSDATVASTPAPPAATTPVAPPKPAWSSPVTPAGASGGPNAASQSLREIQELEAKRSEARKEKERQQRAAALAAQQAASASDEEPLPKTTTWGLGARGTASAAAVATSGSHTAVSPGGASTPTSATAASTTASVWGGNAASTKKKTMKEILEEEERRKKAAAASLAQAQAAHRDSSTNGADSPTSAAGNGKKGYADSAKIGEAKAPSPVTTGSAGGAWVTVGSKATTSSVPAAVTTPALARAPASSTSIKISTAAVASLPARPSAAVISSASTPKKPTAAAVAATQDDKTAGPGPDFLKWLKEALRGLNGVNVDEFIGMLLDFPVEPDATTTEIISEMVYANSKVLDGRRFVSEFVARRKADVARSRGGAGATSSSNENGVGAAAAGPSGSGWGKGSLADGAFSLENFQIIPFLLSDRGISWPCSCQSPTKAAS
ncbi:hypothetical protein DL93DRAFT_1495963 [Clavulina sp. PMI_390]|nr:hypothetical protein DL93DRAFT_1495963 [Clavulina sp. PMI_390]